MDQLTVETGANFEFEGFWWDPTDDAESHRAQGTLRYEPTRGATLSVVDLHPGLDAMSALEPAMAVLHGCTLAGKPCTLFRPMLKESEGQLFGGHSRELWHSNFLVYGEHLTRPEDLVIERVLVSIRGLREWIWEGRDPRRSAPDQSPSKLDRVGRWLIQRLPGSGTAPVDSGPESHAVAALPGATLTLRRGLSGKHGRFLKHEETVAHALFEFERTITWSEFRTGYLSPLHDLVLFATREETRVKFVTLLYAERTEKWWDQENPIESTREVEVVERWTSQPLTERKRPYEHILLPFAIWGDDAPEMIRRWFELRQSLAGTANLFFATLNVRFMYLENQVLNMLSVAEGFHRAFHDELEVDEATHERSVRAMLAALDTDELRAKYKHRFRHANEQTQRTRVRFLFERAATVIEEAETWRRKHLQRLIETRNYLNHQIARSQGVLEGSELALALARLQLVIEINFMLELGMEHDSIEYAVRHSYEGDPALSAVT